MGSVTDRHNQLLNTSRGFKRLHSLIGELTVKVAAHERYLERGQVVTLPPFLSFYSRSE